jgi:hypothetical protein
MSVWKLEFLPPIVLVLLLLIDLESKGDDYDHEQEHDYEAIGSSLPNFRGSVSIAP